MMLGRRCKPHAIVPRGVVPIAQNQHDLLLDVDRQTAKHRPRGRRHRGECVEHELVWRNLAPFNGDDRVIEGMATGIARGFRHYCGKIGGARGPEESVM